MTKIKRGHKLNPHELAPRRKPRYKKPTPGRPPKRWVVWGGKMRKMAYPPIDAWIVPRKIALNMRKRYIAKFGADSWGHHFAAMEQDTMGFSPVLYPPPPKGE